MRIAMVCREMPPIGGGAGTVALQLARELVVAGHEVTFFTMQFGSQPLEELIDGVRAVRIPCGRRSITGARLVEMIRFLRSARHLLRMEHQARPFDVVHAHSILPEGAVASMRGLQARTIITAHGSDVPGHNPNRYGFVHHLTSPWWRATVHRTDAVTAPSEYLAGLIRRRAPDCHVHIIPNGIDGDLFDASDERSGMLIVARLIAAKNVDIALQAMRGLPSTRVDVVGDGPELPRLRAVAATLEEHDIRFHGWLEHGSTGWRKVYENSRFFVSMSSRENFPVNLLEAQAAELTTIASDIPGHREVLGEEAEFVPINVESLRMRLHSLMNEPPESLNERGRLGRSRVVAEFLWSKIREDFVRLYR